MRPANNTPGLNFILHSWPSFRVPCTALAQPPTLIVKVKPTVDEECPRAASTRVYDGDGSVWAASLNLTDADKNTNKFYLLQLLEDSKSGKYFVWSR